MRTPDCLVVEWLFLVGMNWQLSFAIGSSDIRAMLLSFFRYNRSYASSILAGRGDWVSIGIDWIKVLATFLVDFGFLFEIESFTSLLCIGGDLSNFIRVWDLLIVVRKVSKSH